MKSWKFWISACLSAILLAQAVAYAADPARLYVSTQGNDGWSGRLARPNADKSDGPFASLEAARDAVRAGRSEGKFKAGAEVHITGGVYLRDRTFELTEQDSGTESAPMVYRAAPGQKVQLIGGKRITDFQPVTDEAVLERICPEARGKVLQADLKAHGVKEPGEWQSRGFGRVGVPAASELFFDGKPMRIARWPNDEWMKIAGVPEGSKDRFTFDHDRASRWTQARDIWVHGFWTWDWADSYEKVASIDLENKQIVTEPPHGVYGYKQGGRYYVLNLLEEIDRPGEYVVDRQAGLLYFWPPVDVDSAPAYLSTVETMVAMEGVSHTSLCGLTIEVARGSGIHIKGGKSNRVAGCTLRNLGTVGVAIGNGQDSGVISCDIYEVGDAGISLAGGERKTLTPGGLYATNNHIHHYSRTCYCYRSAVVVGGVGNRVDHNLIHDAPHNAILLTGNEHLIELNEIHHVCMDTDDAGAFYMGRDWTERGNVVRYNYFHQIGGHKGRWGVQSIYLDDWSSGTMVYGNICYQGGRGLLLGGGRNNTVENNIFVECTPAVHVDSRGLGWAKKYFNGTTTTLTDRLEAMDYRNPPYSDRYPELLTLYDDEPALAKYNLIARNICVGGRWLDLHDGLTDKVVQLEDNLVDADPGFVNPASGDFRLRPGSAAYKLGFKPIPVDKIGLHTDEWRTSLPPKQQVTGN